MGVYPDGDIKVKVTGQDRLWTLNPECVVKVEPDSAPLTPSTTGTFIVITTYDSCENGTLKKHTHNLYSIPLKKKAVSC